MMRSTAVLHMRAEFRAALAERRDTRRSAARAVRRALHDHRAAVLRSLRHALAPCRPAGPVGPVGLDARVMRIVHRHPDGVRAVEVGNELGVDWRRVLESMRALVDAGLLEQIDLEFYASRKASWGW